MTGQRLAIFLFTAATLLAFTTTLGAATVLQMDMQTLVSHSDTIIIGEVISVEARQAADGRVYTTVDLRVDETVKGTPGETLRVRQVGGLDREADIATYVPGMPHFEPQERAFIFAVQRPDQTSIITGMSQGKFNIALGPDSATEYVIPQLRDLNLIAAEPERSISSSTASMLMTERHTHLFARVHEFESFRHEVQSLVDADSGAN